MPSSMMDEGSRRRHGRNIVHAINALKFSNTSPAALFLFAVSWLFFTSQGLILNLSFALKF